MAISERLATRIFLIGKAALPQAKTVLLGCNEPYRRRKSRPQRDCGNSLSASSLCGASFLLHPRKVLARPATMSILI
jgi:hypothetical protein